jgi:hypothetical protein
MGEISGCPISQCFGGSRRSCHSMRPPHRRVVARQDRREALHRLVPTRHDRWRRTPPASTSPALSPPNNDGCVVIRPPASASPARPVPADTSGCDIPTVAPCRRDASRSRGPSGPHTSDTARLRPLAVCRSSEFPDALVVPSEAATSRARAGLAYCWDRFRPRASVDRPQFFVKTSLSL